MSSDLDGFEVDDWGRRFRVAPTTFKPVMADNCLALVFQHLDAHEIGQRCRKVDKQWNAMSKYPESFRYIIWEGGDVACNIAASRGAPATWSYMVRRRLLPPPKCVWSISVYFSIQSRWFDPQPALPLLVQLGVDLTNVRMLEFYTNRADVLSVFQASSPLLQIVPRLETLTFNLGVMDKHDHPPGSIGVALQGIPHLRFVACTWMGWRRPYGQVFLSLLQSINASTVRAQLKELSFMCTASSTVMREWETDTQELWIGDTSLHDLISQCPLLECLHVQVHRTKDLFADAKTSTALAALITALPLACRTLKLSYGALDGSHRVVRFRFQLPNSQTGTRPVDVDISHSNSWNESHASLANMTAIVLGCKVDIVWEERIEPPLKDSEYYMDDYE